MTEELWRNLQSCLCLKIFKVAKLESQEKWAKNPALAVLTNG